MTTKVECLVAGIVKGIKEHGDVRRHFGSTLALGIHFNEALEHGLVIGDIKTAKLTDLGCKAYDEWQLSKMPEGRSYLWPTLIFYLPCEWENSIIHLNMFARSY